MDKFILYLFLSFILIGLWSSDTRALEIDSANFTSDLSFGMRSYDVTKLQQLLFNQGLLLVNPTGYFGNLTLNALINFQKQNGITPSLGYFGPKTRNFVNQSYLFQNDPDTIYVCEYVSQGAAFDPTNPPPKVCGYKPTKCPPDRRFIIVDFVNEKWPNGDQKGNFSCSSELPS